jgi:hypothetical protein
VIWQNLIGRMWLERHPKRDVLMDVSVAAEIDGPPSCVSVPQRSEAMIQGPMIALSRHEQQA